MATEDLLVLGQSAPLATTLTDVFTVGAGKRRCVSSVMVCNRGAGNQSFRIAVAVGGAADSPEQYIFYDEVIKAGYAYPATLGLTLAEGDVVRVYASNANLSFNFFGSEVTL